MKGSDGDPLAFAVRASTPAPAETTADRGCGYARADQPTIEGTHPMPAVKKRQQNEEDLPDEQVDDEDADDEQMESNNNGIQVNIYEHTLVVELPRDGNEAETLSRLSKFVDGI